MITISIVLIRYDFQSKNIIIIYIKLIEGNKIWMRSFEDDYETKINKIVLLDSNRYLFVGNKVPKTKGKSWINFLSADDQGEFPFEKSSMDSFLKLILLVI